MTIFLTLMAQQYYSIKSFNDANRKQNALFDIIEIADLKSTDLRFKWRGYRPTPSNLALIAIDDISVQEVGRWPWSHAKIAQIVDQVFAAGAKSLAFDIVFAEPEESIRQPGPDLIMTKALDAHRDRVVLGSFSENYDGETLKSLKPYQDYCRNEAFRALNANQFVKLNPTFIMNDLADDFVDLEFKNVLGPIFVDLRQKVEDELLQSYYHKSSLAQLTPQQQKHIALTQNDETYAYCWRWLTDEDEYFKSSEIRNQYSELLSHHEIFKNSDIDQALGKFKMAVASHPVPPFQNWTINIKEFQDSTDLTGSFNAEQDQDGAIRKSALFFRTGNRIGTSFIPSIGLQNYLLSTGLQARVDFDKDPHWPLQKILSRFEIYDSSQDPEKLVGSVPVDNQGRLSLNYYGGSHMFPHVSAKDLLSDSPTLTVSQEIQNPTTHLWTLETREVSKSDFLSGKALIIGATASGIYDLRVTPFEKNYPGPEVHLTLMGNLLDRKFLQSRGNESFWMIIFFLVFGIFFSLFISKLSALSGFLLTFFSLTLILFTDSILFERGYLVTTVLPLFLVLTLYMILTFYKYLTEERKKKYLRSTFSKYVSPAIVDEILKDPSNVDLGGQKMTLTVFFSDIRGFTTFSESMDAKVLAQFLNRYLTPMTNVIFANKGTLDKYMGDGIMAFFGAPIAFADNAECACRAALQSLKELEKLNQVLKKENWPPLSIGIGLNTSEMNVGNMGSDVVRSYTVIGDAVNLGSRLEGVTKEYGVQIIISEFTRDLIQNQFTTRKIGLVRVKGRKQPVQIFELISEGPAPIEWQEALILFHEALENYLRKDFSRALGQFKLCLIKRPEDGPSQIYLDRCLSYIQSPPPADWDGVDTMTSK